MIELPPILRPHHLRIIEALRGTETVTQIAATLGMRPSSAHNRQAEALTILGIKGTQRDPRVGLIAAINRGLVEPDFTSQHPAPDLTDLTEKGLTDLDALLDVLTRPVPFRASVAETTGKTRRKWDKQVREAYDRFHLPPGKSHRSPRQLLAAAAAHGHVTVLPGVRNTPGTRHQRLRKASFRELGAMVGTLDDEPGVFVDGVCRDLIAGFVDKASQALDPKGTDVSRARARTLIARAGGALSS